MEVQIARWLLLLLLIATPALAADTWLQGYYGPTNTGQSTVAVSSSPTLLWTLTGVSPVDGVSTIHPDSGSVVTADAVYTSADKNPADAGHPCHNNSCSEFYRLTLAGSGGAAVRVWTYDTNRANAKHDGLVTLDAAHNVVIFPAHDGRLRALDLTTGALVWAYDLTGQPEGGPTLVGGVLYYLGQAALIALDPGTLISSASCSSTALCPTLLWSVARNQPAHGPASKIAVNAGVVYWGGAEEFTASDATNNGAQVCRRTSGLTGWTYGFSAIHYHAGVVYSGASDFSSSTPHTLVTAYNPTTCLPIWEFDRPVDNFFKHVLSASLGLLIGGYGNADVGGGVIAYNLSDGSEAWRTPWPRVLNLQASVGGTGGGFPAADTYRYRINAIVAGIEVGQTVDATAVVSATTQKVTLTWDAFAEATGYRAYRIGSAIGQFQDTGVQSRIADLGAVTTYVDDGVATPSGRPGGAAFTNGAPALSSNDRVIVLQSSGTAHMLNAATGAVLWSYPGGDTMHGATSMATVTGGGGGFVVPDNTSLRLFSAAVADSPGRTGSTAITGSYVGR